MTERYVIGIDQGYAVTGVALVRGSDEGTEVVNYKRLVLEKYKTNTDRRMAMRRSLRALLKNLLETKSVPLENILIIVERIRVFSGGGIHPNYMIAVGALIAVIVDTAQEYGLEVFSVDTRAWKSKVVGTTKGVEKQVLITRGKNKGKYRTEIDNKKPTLDFVKNTIGIDCKGQDDVADAICIALYGFIDESEQKLKLET